MNQILLLNYILKNEKLCVKFNGLFKNVYKNIFPSKKKIIGLFLLDYY